LSGQRLAVRLTYQASRQPYFAVLIYELPVRWGTLMRIRLATCLLILMPLSVMAKSPSDIADLVGARAAGAESEMQARGYVDVGGNNTWWNASKKQCVKVRVSQGRYSSISQLKASSCGQKTGSAKKCPSDLSQADLYKYPGCSL